MQSAEVQVWRACLRPAPPRRERLWSWLSSDERERAGRYHFAKDRDAFIAARGTLRALLGAYLRQSPEAVGLVCGAHGKPAAREGGIQFNVSHSGDCALFAFSQSGDVGVDIESQERAAPLDVAKDYFSPTEWEKLLSLPLGDQPLAFYQCWTRKEALLKALGTGLAAPLDEFAVAFGPDEAPRLLHGPACFGQVSRWSLANVAAGPGYVAALALRHDEDDHHVRTVMENGGRVNPTEGLKPVTLPLAGTTLFADSLVSVMLAEVN